MLHFLLCLPQILLQQLERLRPVITELRQRLPECVDAGLRKLGSVLTATRGKAAKIVEQSLTESLHTLGMPRI